MTQHSPVVTDPTGACRADLILEVNADSLTNLLPQNLVEQLHFRHDSIGVEEQVCENSQDLRFEVK